MNVKVKEFNQALVNSGSNYDSLMVVCLSSHGLRRAFRFQCQSISVGDASKTAFGEAGDRFSTYSYGLPYLKGSNKSM
jgi:hypothetical protein